MGEDPLPPIHRAAFEGDENEVARLVAEDSEQLDAQIQGGVEADGYMCTPLILAARQGHGAVVARLLALGANLELQCEYNRTALHNACIYADVSTVRLLLHAGSPVNTQDMCGFTPLIAAISTRDDECVKLLLTRGGIELDLNAQDEIQNTALHHAVQFALDDGDKDFEAAQLLLDAGADPDVMNGLGPPISIINPSPENQPRIALLNEASNRPYCLRKAQILLKARALFDAAHAIKAARRDARDKGMTATGQRANEVATVPRYLKQRVAQEQALPDVQVVDVDVDEEEEEEEVKLVAFMNYAQGVGEHEEGGMVKEVFVELCELLAPKWARKDM